MLAISSEPETITKPHHDEIRQEEPSINLEENNNPRLHKQNSIFALTLDEIQCKSGRSFGSMNMEDFIANIWSVDQDNNGQLSTVRSLDHDNNDQGQSNKTSDLPRQGSFSIPIPLCKKTIDEIWFDLHKGDGKEDDEEEEELNRTVVGRQGQPTLGEMTLEDFLVKAGVVQDQPISSLSQRQQSIRSRISVPGINGTAFSAYQVYGQGNHDAGNLGESSGTNKGKKRIIDGRPEVVVERRQRRMIKNRESAARSRARKQAYTVELEVELNQLKEENEKLKQVMSEVKRKQEVLLKRKKYTTRAQKLAEKLRKLRRAASLTW